jgi:hypothetical protein
LVQTEDYANSSELFSNDYAYFSSASTGWLEHAKKYVYDITKFLNLSKNSFVVEVASNDGYLLKNFLQIGIPCLGIEPTECTAIVAENMGINVLREFFNTEISQSIVDSHGKADLICGNNVYAHVPDINDFTKAISFLLKKDGVVTLEFPHLQNLINLKQFDTVYHEHFSYLSLTTVNKIFCQNNLRIFNVEKLETHGGSLRIYGCLEGASHQNDSSVKEILEEENVFGISNLSTYKNFQNSINIIKNDFVDFLITQNKLGKKVAGYGAAAKGNTLLNFAGIKNDLIAFVSDTAPSKQHKYLPGSHIPVLPTSALRDFEPDYVIIFPWNIADEILNQEAELIGKGAKFVIAIPALRFLN